MSVDVKVMFHMKMGYNVIGSAKKDGKFLISSTRFIQFRKVLYLPSLKVLVNYNIWHPAHACQNGRAREYVKYTILCMILVNSIDYKEDILL